MNEWNKVDNHQRHIFLFYTIEMVDVFSEMFIIWDDITMIIVCHACSLEEVLEVATSLRHAQFRATPCVPGHLPQLFLADASGEVLHDLLQLLDGFRLRFHHAIQSHRPEREVQAGQVGLHAGQ